MPRLSEIPWERAPKQTKKLLDQVASGWDLTPATTLTMAHSPAVLQGYLALRDALQGGTLDPLLGARLGIMIAQANRSSYCLVSQAALGWLTGLEEAELQAARWARSSDSKIEAALTFARAIVDYHAEFSDEEFNRVRRAGYTDEEIAEIVGNIALHIFTNYFNLVARIEADFQIEATGDPNAA